MTSTKIFYALTSYDDADNIGLTGSYDLVEAINICLRMNHYHMTIVERQQGSFSDKIVGYLYKQYERPGCLWTREMIKDGE